MSGYICTCERLVNMTMGMPTLPLRRMAYAHAAAIMNTTIQAQAQPQFKGIRPAGQFPLREPRPVYTGVIAALRTEGTIGRCSPGTNP